MSYERHMLSEFPDISKYFKPELNEGLLPEEIPYQSTKKRVWQCEHDHIWTRSVGNMVNHFKECQFCADKKVWSGENDVATKYPTLLEEWDYEKNENSPEETWWRSTKPVHWKCERGHEWTASVAQRLQSRPICPVCAPIAGTSFPEQALYYFCRQQYPDAVNRAKIPIDGTIVEADVFIPSQNVVIEYNGKFFHQDKNKHDTQKEKLFFD